MLRIVSKVVICLISALSGVFGFCLLLIGPGMLVYAIFHRELELFWLSLFTTVIFIPIGGYPTWATYSLWRRWSPAAVRHTCAASGFLTVLFVLVNFFQQHPFWSISPLALYAAVLLGSLFSGYLGYSLIGYCFNRVLFVAKAASPQA
jgi:hypothetical protein